MPRGCLQRLCESTSNSYVCGVPSHRKFRASEGWMRQVKPSGSIAHTSYVCVCYMFGDQAGSYGNTKRLFWSGACPHVRGAIGPRRPREIVRRPPAITTPMLSQAIADGLSRNLAGFALHTHVSFEGSWTATHIRTFVWVSLVLRSLAPAAKQT